MKKSLIYVTTITVMILVAAGFVHMNKKNISSAPSENMVALGDSLTHGVGDPSGEGYVENIEEHVKKENKSEIKVANYGIPGQETGGLLRQIHLTNVRLDIKKADYIILFIGTNDLIQSNGGDLDSISKEKIKAGQEEYENNLNEILQLIRTENSDAPILFLGLYNPQPDNTELEEIIVEWNQNSQGMIKDYERVKFISTNDLFMEKSKKYFSDSLHPNEEGYELLTQKILEEYDF